MAVIFSKCNAQRKDIPARVKVKDWTAIQKKTRKVFMSEVIDKVE